MPQKLKTLGQNTDFSFKNNVKWYDIKKHTGAKNNRALVAKYLEIIPASTHYLKVTQDTMDLVRNRLWERDDASNNAVNKCCGVIQAALNFALERGRITLPKGDLSYIRSHKQMRKWIFAKEPERKVTRPIFSHDQIIHMYDMGMRLSREFGGTYSNCAETILLSAYTGMGWAEFHQLKACDIHLDIDVPVIAIGHRSDFTIKRDVRRRSIPLLGAAEKLIPMLRRRIVEAEGDPDVRLFGDDWYGCKDGGDQHRRVFDNITDALGIMYDSRGIKRTPYCLRHTFCTNSIRFGKDIFRTSKLMGHSSVITTDNYAHLETEDLIQAMPTFE